MVNYDRNDYYHNQHKLQQHLNNFTFFNKMVLDYELFYSVENVSKSLINHVFFVFWS